MFNIDPYKTTYGKNINTSKLVTELTKYYIENGSVNLGYEFATNGDCDYLLVSGKNDDEKELPLWDHPIVVTMHNNNKFIAVDLRRYLNITGDVSELTDSVKDINGFIFTMLRAMLMMDVVNEDYSALKDIEKNLASAFAMWISDTINSAIGLNPIEKLNVELAAGYYFYIMMLNRDPESEDLRMIAYKLSKTKLSLPSSLKSIESVVANLDGNIDSIDGLIGNIRIVLGEPKNKLIDLNMLVNIIANSWFGPNGSESVLMSLEHYPTFVAMVYVNLNSKIYKRSRIAMSLDKNNNKIKGKDIAASVDKYIKSRTVL